MRLSVHGLSAGYGSGTVINDLDLTVDTGETVAVVGRNGMGKSTFVKALLGYLPGSRGRVLVNDVDVSDEPTHRIVRHGIAYAPQEDALFADLSVRDNLYGGLQGKGPGREVEEHVFGHFPVLERRLEQRAGTLSGGEQKLLLLSRCLFRRPQAIVLDEISAGLQPSMISAVSTVLSAARASGQLTVLMIEQNVDLCMAVADRTQVMKLGNFVTEVSTQDTQARTTLIDQLAP